MRSDKPSLWLTPDGGAMETVTTHTNASWELHIITHLISHCKVGALEQIDEGVPANTGSDFEDHNLGYVKVELVPVVKPKVGKRLGEMLVMSYYIAVLLALADVCAVVMYLSNEDERYGKETPNYIKHKFCVCLWL